ncbi:MAG: DUF3048 domain-containing protein [Pseudonocardiales bacterium]|nr:DUF3048 domain-containing protein [Actinomycetota bacterium]
MKTHSRTVRLVCAALSLTCVMSVAACGGSHKKKKKAVSSSAVITPTATATKTTPKPKPKPPVVDPLTGGKVVAGPVVAVKIDDTAAGRPQAGIEQADIVYIEQVEGGLTRTMAVFHSHKPAQAGPVRSVRANDPEVLSQYGPIAFAASGGGGDSLTELDRSSLRADISDRGGPGFSRDGNRPVPYNLMLNFAALPATLGAGAKAIGFTWSPLTKRAALFPKSASLRTVVGGTPVQFDWNPHAQKYVRLIDGALQHAASGATIATPNVIVQFCKGHVNPNDVDQAGNPGFFTESIGKGRLAVYRSGHRIDGYWQRKSAGSGTALKDKYNQDIALAPGGAWVVLVDSSAPLS